MRQSSPAFVLSQFLLVPAVSADLPLTVEDLFTAHHRYRLETSLEYRNWESSDVSLGYLQGVDTAVLSAGLRYGATLNTELFVKAYAYAADQRQQVLGTTRSRSDSDWSRVLVGMNHRFSPDNATPALLGFTTLDLVENGVGEGTTVEYTSGGSFGLTTYRSLDPLLLSAVLSYTWRSEREVSSIDVDPGDSLAFSPQVAFAVNHLVTLTGGFRWEWRESARWEHRDATIDRTRTSLLLGLGYNWSEDFTLSINGQFAVTDHEGSSLSVSAVYRFDDGRVGER